MWIGAMYLLHSVFIEKLQRECARMEDRQARRVAATSVNSADRHAVHSVPAVPRVVEGCHLPRILLGMALSSTYCRMSSHTTCAIDNMSSEDRIGLGSSEIYHFVTPSKYAFVVSTPTI